MTATAAPAKSDSAILPLRLEGVAYAAGGTTLIDGVTATLAAGPRTVILGPNGAGKSLLLRLCHGLIQPSAGSVRWLGRQKDSPRLYQAMVFQRPVMLRRSVLGNIIFALRLHGQGASESHSRSIEMLERTGLAGFAHRPARVLSGGEQQRLALARAWALQPEVLFLDEPTASLDPAATRVVEELVDSIHRSGTKIVMTTHDLGQAHRLADEIMFLYRGHLIETATAERFFAGPATTEASAFLRGELTW
jgi:tungstate transport system ATP-binding protein